MFHMPSHPVKFEYLTADKMKLIYEYLDYNALR